MILENFLSNSSKANEKSAMSEEGCEYSSIYYAYLSSEECAIDGILNIGYKNAEKTIGKLINSL